MKLELGTGGAPVAAGAEISSIRFERCIAIYVDILLYLEHYVIPFFLIIFMEVMWCQCSFLKEETTLIICHTCIKHSVVTAMARTVVCVGVIRGSLCI